MSFPSGSQSILHAVDPQSAVQTGVVNDGVSSEHEVSVATSDAVGSKSPQSQGNVCFGPSEASMDLSVCRKRKDRSLLS